MSDSKMVAMVKAGEGKVLRAYGDEVRIHLCGRETCGRVTMFTTTTQPGGGPPPHRHDREDEWFLVVEGLVSYLVDGKWTDGCGPGTSVFAPRGSVHAFKNVGDGPSKQLITVSPSGFEDFFAKSAEEFSRAGGPRMERILEIGREFGIHFE